MISPSLLDRRLLASCLAVALFALGSAGLMFFFKYESNVGGTRQARMNYIAHELGDLIEKSVALGISLAESPRLEDATRRRLEVDPLVRRISITDAGGQPVVSAERSESIGALPQTVSVTPRNSFDLPLGTVTLTYDGEPLQGQRLAFSRALLFASTLLIPLCGVLAAFTLAFASRRLDTRLALAASVLWLAAGIIALGAVAHSQWERDLAPEFSASALVVSRSAATLFGRAAELELPLGDLPGVEQFFASHKASHPEFAAFLVTAGDTVIHRHGVVPVGATMVVAPIQRLAKGTVTDGAMPETVGEVRIAIDPAATRRLLREMALDLITIIIVAGFLAGELFRFLLRDSHVDDPTVSNAARELASLRAPAFLLFLAEDLSRAFFPVFASHLNPSPLLEALGVALTPRLLGGIPVTAFMLAVALAQPLVGDLARRHGARNVLLGAIVAAAAAHALAAMCERIDALLLVRIVAALAWAVAFSAVQGAVLEKVGREHRAWGMAYFVGIIMTSSICGPSMGGILADSLGQRATLGIAAFVA
ncbi:MAG: MFS transporter, partial [Rhodocyclaceae bacterium]|nr:MFS transporter [Rhodocyclaceae bacterium]